MSEKEKKKIVTIHGVCQKCVTNKVVLNHNPVDEKGNPVDEEGNPVEEGISTTCIAFSEAERMRYFKAGWCPLGNSGNKPPTDHIGKDSKKKRVGQQKQKK